MKRATGFTLVGILLFVVVVPAAALYGDDKDHVRYEKYYRDPVLERMREEMDSLRAVCDSITAEIDKIWKDKKKKEKDEREVIRFDFEGVKKPASPEVFDPPFHFKPVPQFYTGTCWSFCTTSFLESEVARLTGRKIKLSELHTVYWEFVEKARGYVQKRGNQVFEQGSESDAVILVWNKYGAVPLEAYTGLVEGNDKHNHKLMTDEMKKFLKFMGKLGCWDEEAIIAGIRRILVLHIARPPEKFEFEGVTVTPLQFIDEVLKIDTDDYVQFMSTLKQPFYEMGEFEVTDNWRPTETYMNVPLDEFYKYIKSSAEKGYTVCIGGDVSEPGYYGFEDAAIVPSFDIPNKYIDQDSREFRFFNGTTDDDHGVHLLAYKKVGGRDWFLIKDSARSARHGDHWGYYFYRDDYIKLKMLTYMVHKDAVKDLLKKCKTTSD